MSSLFMILNSQGQPLGELWFSSDDIRLLRRQGDIRFAYLTSKRPSLRMMNRKRKLSHSISIHFIPDGPVNFRLTTRASAMEVTCVRKTQDRGIL